MIVMPSKGLLVRRPWIDLILDGLKTWELRGSSTKKRGTVALIAAGEGRVLGTVDFVDALGPLSEPDLDANFERHRVGREAMSAVTYRKMHAWVVANPVRWNVARPYRHPMGAVIWVDLAKAD